MRNGDAKMKITKSKVNIMKLNNMGYLCVPVNHKQNDYAENLLKSLGAPDELYQKTHRIYLKENERGEIKKMYLVLKQNFNSHTLTYSVDIGK